MSAIPEIEVWDDDSDRAANTIALINRWSETLGIELPHRIIRDGPHQIKIRGIEYWKLSSIDREINKVGHEAMAVQKDNL